MVWTSRQARMYDMPRDSAAAVRQSCSAIAARSATLPGPSATSAPRSTRIRGRTRGAMAAAGGGDADEGEAGFGMGGAVSGISILARTSIYLTKYIGVVYPGSAAATHEGRKRMERGGLCPGSTLQPPSRGASPLRPRAAAAIVAAALVLAAAAGAQAPAAAQPAPAASGAASDWFSRVDQTQAEQPHWMTPLLTVTPRLEEEVRYDKQWQSRPNDATLTNYGVGKGLELIPLERVEVILGIPAYEVLDTTKGTKRGWADETFLVKYRAVAADESHGNYIVTGFLGVSVPTGDTAFTTNHYLYTPTLAAGKGWGTRTQGMDIQSTLAAAIPASDEQLLGVPVVWNTALQDR